jgi:hypothetical protein
MLLVRLLLLLRLHAPLRARMHAVSPLDIYNPIGRIHVLPPTAGLM